MVQNCDPDVPDVILGNCNVEKSVKTQKYFWSTFYYAAY